MSNLGVVAGQYFDENAMVGNMEHFIHEAFRNNDESLLDCLKDVPEEREAFSVICNLLAKIDKMLCIPEATP